MNEKIKRLVSQIKTDTSGKWVSIDNMEQFAESIVQECCQVLLEEVEVALSASGDVVWPEGLIKEHFGIKE